MEAAFVDEAPEGQVQVIQILTQTPMASQEASPVWEVQEAQVQVTQIWSQTWMIP
jgi:hypothetical protein